MNPNEELTKKCPACAESVQSEAKKCRFCGEVFNQHDMKSGFRGVSLRLKLGILFFPIIFTWFTLRSGYSFKARFFSFLWMVLITLGAMSDKKRNVEPPQTSTVAASPTQDSESIQESMWIMGTYVDEFGEKTKDNYITNRKYLFGTFSNSATTNSDLKVSLIIDSPKKISIQLYEYAGKNPVKSYGEDHYRISAKDKNGKKYQMNATNYSDRLVLNGPSALKMHNILKTGGKAYFVIEEARNTITTYSFSIENADGYSKLVSQK